MRNLNKEQRKNQLLQALQTPTIQNNNTMYHQLAQPQNMGFDETKTQLITVNLDQLKPYEGNPRRTKNPAFEDIKESIKQRGLDHAPNITKRPGDDFYTILDGGNTRLQALSELFKETQESRFYTIECIYKPWQNEDEITNEVNMLIGHLAENDLRGELSFIEKALGIEKVRKLYEKKYNEYFSHRQLSEKLKENGYPISNNQISRMSRTIEYLYPFIPNVLFSGLGRPQIEKLLTMHTNSENAYEMHKAEFTPNKIFSSLWGDALKLFDTFPDEFALTIFQDELLGSLVESFDNQVSYDTLKLDISMSPAQRKKLQEQVQAQLISMDVVADEKPQETLRRKISQNADQNSSVEEEETSVIETIDSVDDSTSADMDFNLEAIAQSIDSEVDAESIQNMLDRAKTKLDGFATQEELQQLAETNGLGFTNVGRQNVADIWAVHANRKPLLEMYSLALDIAEEYGFTNCIEKIDADYHFVVNECTQLHSPLAEQVHSFLTVLETADLSLKRETIIELSTDLLKEISDCALVKLMRLIRLHRYVAENLFRG